MLWASMLASSTIYAPRENQENNQSPVDKRIIFDAAAKGAV